jgi:hypothetical protein
MISFFLALFLLIVHPSPAKAQDPSPFMQPIAQEAALREDLQLILNQAQLPVDLIDFQRSQGGGEPRNLVKIACSPEGKILLSLHAEDPEWSATFYRGLQELGFLFPHPRMQISPSLRNLQSVCAQSDKTVEWKPMLKHRGFHFHTQHPNEWVHGFLMDQPQIAEDSIRWLARNMQNTFSLVLLKDLQAHWKTHLSHAFDFAHRLGISPGIAVSFASQQQKSYRLVRRPLLWSILDPSGRREIESIRSALTELIQTIPFDFMMIELGTSEFTSANYEKTLHWIETAQDSLSVAHQQLFIKTHVSSNQNQEPYGNYNFLPQYSSQAVGILPHTVMYYSLLDARAPVYGRENFADMKGFLEQESKHRLTWYFPETSYYIGIDIDVPLFLTDTLVARSQDMAYLAQHQIPGQLCFTTGQELGYWLFDWTVALMTNQEHVEDPLIGLKLLGEDPQIWQTILTYQSQYLKNPGLLSLLSSSTLLDELPFFHHSPLERTVLAALKDRPEQIVHEIALLQEAKHHFPSLEAIQNFELKAMLELTRLRIHQALSLRKALLHSSSSRLQNGDIEESAQTRALAQRVIMDLKLKSERYPEAHLFERQSNPTSYPYGYAWSAYELHFWTREERMIRDSNYSPFFMNIFDPLKIVF